MDRPPRSPPPRPSKPRSSSKNDTDNLRIDCWLYGGIQDTEFNFKCDKINSNDIESWLREPSPRSISDDKQPSAGLRLICREQKTSVTKPFDKATLQAINNVVGLPASHTYLTIRDAGVCGKYMAKTDQPGELQYMEYVLMHV